MFFFLNIIKRLKDIISHMTANVNGEGLFWQSSIIFSQKIKNNCELFSVPLAKTEIFLYNKLNL